MPELHRGDDDFAAGFRVPDRLIGACEGCKHWYLIDILPDVSGGTMLRLPDMQVIRNLSRRTRQPGFL